MSSEEGNSSGLQQRQQQQQQQQSKSSESSDPMMDSGFCGSIGLSSSGSLQASLDLPKAAAAAASNEPSEGGSGSNQGRANEQEDERCRELMGKMNLSGELISISKSFTSTVLCSMF